MLRRIESEERHDALLAPYGLASTAAIVPAITESECETHLPHDHPHWSKDTVTVSQRARNLIARLIPIAIRVLTYWDHRLRSVLIGSTRIHIDPSGSYRTE